VWIITRHSIMNNQTCSPSGKRQQGAVLVIGLIILLLMTIIGVTGIRTTSLEEKMSGNMRNRNLAFQAAESALSAAEIYLNTASPFPTPFCKAESGRYVPMDNNCDGSTESQQVWDSINWSANSVAYTGVLSNLTSNPRYIIEDLGCVAPPASCPGPHNYRITARASGGTADAIVILQEIYQI
jgi:type IV pilus assembly protein PilX